MNRLTRWLELYSHTPDGLTGIILSLVGLSMWLRAPAGSLQVLSLPAYVLYASILIVSGLMIGISATTVSMVRTLIGSLLLLPILVISLIGSFSTIDIESLATGIPSIQVAIYAGVITIPIVHMMNRNRNQIQSPYIRLLMSYLTIERLTGLLLLSYALLIIQRPVGSVFSLLVVFRATPDGYAIAVLLFAMLLFFIRSHFLTLIIGNAPILIHIIFTVTSILQTKQAPLVSIVLFAAYFAHCVYVAFDREEWDTILEHHRG